MKGCRLGGARAVGDEWKMGVVERLQCWSVFEYRSRRPSLTTWLLQPAVDRYSIELLVVSKIPASELGVCMMALHVIESTDAL